MKKTLPHLVLLLVLSSISFTSHSLPEYGDGKVQEITSGIDAFYVKFSKAHSCGNAHMFHVLRTQSNFDDLYALLLTAKINNKTVTILTHSGCYDDMRKIYQATLK